jgi:hypothetical protein
MRRGRLAGNGGGDDTVELTFLVKNRRLACAAHGFAVAQAG